MLEYFMIPEGQTIEDKNRMVNYWMAVGTQENWKEAFRKGNIWGLRKRQSHHWNALQESDIILFYVMRPVAGIIGYGTIKTKFRQTQPLRSEEVDRNEVVWPLRFEFNVVHCLPPDKWQTDKITSELLRYKTGVGFQHLNFSLAQEIVSKFRERQIEEIEEPISHKEVKQKLIEIGKLQNYIAEGEYPFDLGGLDVVWRRVERSEPTYVEVAEIKHYSPYIQEVTRGFGEDIVLRERYQKEDFGLETVFEKQEWAEGRVTELKETYGLTDADIRLVKHISTPKTGKKPAWEIYVKAGRGLPVFFSTPAAVVRNKKCCG